jgi:hypothetical protein
VQLQPTALIVALLLLFACAAIENRRWETLLFGALVSIKITYLLPVFGLLLFRRQYRLLGTLAGCILALNLLAMLPTGFRPTLEAYRQNTREYDKPGSPFREDARLFNAWQMGRTPQPDLEREWNEPPGDQVHLAFTFSAWTGDVPLAKRLNLVGALVILALLAWLWGKTAHSPLTENRLYLATIFATLMSASLLVVYHQRYDAIALFPLAFVALAYLKRNRNDLTAWAALGTVFVFAWAMNKRALDFWQQDVVGSEGLFFLIPLCGYLALAAFVAAFCLTQRYARLSPEAVVASDVRPVPVGEEYAGQASG